MNFTMIRNWVGQIGDDEFFDACDRYGIVVWQDFWLANPVDGPDPDDDDLFLRNVRITCCASATIPRLAYTCGRNEGYPAQAHRRRDSRQPLAEPPPRHALHPQLRRGRGERPRPLPRAAAQVLLPEPRHRQVP